MNTPPKTKNEYKETLNLPQTGFGMRANLAQKEPEYLKRWEEEDLYGSLRKARATAPKYILHDGPPYPTGDLHIGTGMNKILKDFIVRYRNMTGYDAPFIPGWDCHGLPIEHKVMTELGDKAEKMTPAQIRALCLKFALRYVEANRRQFKSLGCLGRWEKPYLTINPEYESGVIRVFSKLVKKGYVFRQLKPIHWCFSCRTALAEAELEYADRYDPSIFVEFPFVAESASTLAQLAGIPDDQAGKLSIMIWTTTPWTLPANLAVAVHPSFKYSLVKARRPHGGQERLIVLAAEAVKRVGEETGLGKMEVIATVFGEDLLNLKYQQPLTGGICPVIGAEYVTLEDGTGCVHTAPGHGADDYISGMRHGLEVYSPVDDEGKFTNAAGELAGHEVFAGNNLIIDQLTAQGFLWGKLDIQHSYPHCWRCHNPVIFRATQQWFVSLSHKELRQEVLKEVGAVNWFPSWGQTRIEGMLEQRPDWCISRQRNWGVPIPVIYCRACGETLLTPEVIDRVADLFARQGADSWFCLPVSELIGENIVCPACGKNEFQKENDIFDVWFESGSSHRSVVMQEEGLRFPADLYLEGSDQHRGWFQLSLLLSTAAESQAPFRSVLTHGFVVDEKGEKMSKSRGNFISVDQALKKFPADILRLWFSSVDYRRDIHVSYDLMKRTADAYRKIRNTFRHSLGNLADFDPRNDLVPIEQMEEIDRWILGQTHDLLNSVTEAYEAFEFHRVYRDVHNFCVLQMSAVYLDVLKDRLYTWPASSPIRRSCQSALWEIVVLLAKILAPILPFTTEEVWGYISERLEQEGSIHLSEWPQPIPAWKNPDLDKRWDRLLGVREVVLKALEEARTTSLIGNSLAAEVRIELGDEDLTLLLKKYLDFLPALFIVSSVKVIPQSMGEEMKVTISPAPGEKCMRCWKYSTSVGENKDHPMICRECLEHIS